MKNNKAYQAYQAGFGDAQAIAVYNLRFAVRDICEYGECAKGRLLELEKQILNMEMPQED